MYATRNTQLCRSVTLIVTQSRVRFMDKRVSLNAYKVAPWKGYKSIMN